ncbi:unnamed protein product [Mytilus coruscus]|uniref:Uncharacterized protein n=1 Tax=Mytilus coruscus TaxID=42192 RepID=A0A6J8BM96_MYTCO|nr:unnamed protein product [Mytilus coruscus]
MFNNRLEEKWLTEEIDTYKREIIRNTLESCRLDRGTSRLTLIDAFDSLLGTFLKKEKGVYKALHDTIFDFLACYLGCTYTYCLIKHAVSEVFMQRCVLNEMNVIMVMPKFIIIIQRNYHELFMNRMIQDWYQRRVQCVFHNINMKLHMFRLKFFTFLSKLDNTSQRQLAHTCDINNNETVLSLCSYLGDISLVKWCLGLGVDVNQCDSFGVSPLYISARKGHTKIVKLLLNNKADLDNSIDDGKSPLFVARQNNHTDIVRLLLEKGAYYDNCNIKSFSPEQIASENVHNDIITLINENSGKIDHPEDVSS